MSKRSERAIVSHMTFMLLSVLALIAPLTAADLPHVDARLAADMRPSSTSISLARIEHRSSRVSDAMAFSSSSLREPQYAEYADESAAFNSFDDTTWIWPDRASFASPRPESFDFADSRDHWLRHGVDTAQTADYVARIEKASTDGIDTVVMLVLGVSVIAYQLKRQQRLLDQPQRSMSV